MHRHSHIRPERHMQPEQKRLTEDNLRLHSLSQTQTSSGLNICPINQQTWVSPSEWYQRYDYDYDESEENASQRDMALKKAASLEALQAYGGCFVSGFLAMQEPLPWSPRTENHKRFRPHIRRSDLQDLVMVIRSPATGSLETATITSYNSDDSPRPD